MSTTSREKIVVTSTLERAIINLRQDIEDVSTPPSSTAYTLSTSGWSGSSAPYSYTLNVPGVTASNVVIVSIANSLGTDDFDAQYDENVNADLRRVIQSADTLTFMAYGEKPTIDLMYDISVL